VRPVNQNASFWFIFLGETLYGFMVRLILG